MSNLQIYLAKDKIRAMNFFWKFRKFFNLRLR